MSAPTQAAALAVVAEEAAARLLACQEPGRGVWAVASRHDPAGWQPALAEAIATSLWAGEEDGDC